MLRNSRRFARSHARCKNFLLRKNHGLRLNWPDLQSGLSKISEFSYSGTELDAVAGAANYYGWILDSFDGAIGRRIIEAGAGIGTVSQLLMERTSPDQLVLIEPAGNNIPRLRQAFAGNRRVTVLQGYLENPEISASGDTVIAVNVLEHVENDAAFLAAAFRRLDPGGSLLLLVPAIPAIYGTLDRAFDHYRRYTRPALSKSLLSTGFEIDTIRYLNLPGVAAWFTAGRILRRTTLGRRQVQLYDRFVIPWLRRIESVVRPPIGQSLLVIARKPKSSGGK